MPFLTPHLGQTSHTLHTIRMAYTDEMEDAWCAFADADTMEEWRRIFDAMFKAAWALRETQELEVTQTTKLREEPPNPREEWLGPREEQTSTCNSPMTNLLAEVKYPSSSSPTYAATTALSVLGVAKQAELVGSSRPSSETQFKLIYSTYVPAQMDKNLEVLDFPSSMDPGGGQQ